MRNASRYFAGIMLGLTLVAGTVWAQSTKTIGGNTVVQRTYTDNDPNFFLMDTNHPFTADGTLTHWEIYAGNTNPVALVIYRQSGDSFIEVGRSAVVTPHVGYNLFPLRRWKIKVEPGDFVGAYYPGAVGSISFSLDGLETDVTCFFGSLGRTAVFAPAPNSTNFVCSSNRHYSLRAFGKEFGRWGEEFGRRGEE